MRITQVADVTDKSALNGCRAIIFAFTLEDGAGRKQVTQPCKWGTSYAQYEANALGAMAEAGYKVRTDWTWVAVS